MSKQLLNFLAASPNGHDTVTNKQLKELLLETGGQIMCRGELRDIVSRAHAKGRKVRFWAIPAIPDFYDELLSAGVDFINADDLSMLRDHLIAGGWAKH